MLPVIQTIHITSDFQKAFKRLHKNIKELSVKQDQAFRVNPYHSKLGLHALKGPLEGYHAYSINKDYSIVFRFITPQEVIYYDIGTHSIYSPIQRKILSND